MAIWFTKDRMTPGPVFGSKDYFVGLAIILDTYSNHNGPHNVSGCVLLHFYFTNVSFQKACTPIHISHDKQWVIAL